MAGLDGSAGRPDWMAGLGWINKGPDIGRFIRMLRRQAPPVDTESTVSHGWGVARNLVVLS
jgi:hypothetical protein